MKIVFPLLLLFICCTHAYAQMEMHISTEDIDHFWTAYDKLPEAKTFADSVQIMQTEYIDRATNGFKKFLRVRNFTAEEYITVLSAYPSFWKSIRSKTENIKYRQAELELVMTKLEAVIPHFKMPEICFAIGTLRTGGTTTPGWILIGSEIAAADSTVNTSEFSGWLKSVIGNTGDIVSMVTHETVHTQQSIFLRSNLLSQSMKEGTADFITQTILGLNINSGIYAYGNANACTLWKEFEPVMYEKDYSNWLYNGNASIDRPADLGYFIGAQIAEAYYNNSADKRQAISMLLKSKKYKKVFAESAYNPCNL